MGRIILFCILYILASSHSVQERIINSLSESSVTNAEVDAPVVKLNFYLMGKSDIEQEIILDIGENVDYLNEEFEGKVVFKLNKLFMDEKHDYLPNVYADYKSKNRRPIGELVKGIEEAGALNIFLLETYTEGKSNKALMGFTPILSRYHKIYEKNSPRYDRMFIAYPSLAEQSTLVHEMGHFLGLSHPWEMNSLDMELLGLNDTDTLNRNHMTYNFNVDQFTEQQLNRMQDFARRFRNYLLES